MKKINQKVVLVTGASSGIGKEIARQLIKNGHQVYVAARRLHELKELEIAGAKALAMDITNEQDIQQMVAQIKQETGGVDVLINNAGYAIYGSVEDTDMADARRQFEVNIFGLARLTQLVLPEMRNKKSGRIINISSVGGKIYTPLGAWYHATKHALEGWSDCLRVELAPFGIDVVIIEPGGIKTEFGEVMMTPLLERSGNTAYSKMAHSVARSTHEMYAKNSNLSDPSVIAVLVAKIVNKKKPKTRYVKGYMSKLLLFMRSVLSDKMFDRLLKSQLK